MKQKHILMVVSFAVVGYGVYQLVKSKDSQSKKFIGAAAIMAGAFGLTFAFA